MTEEDYDIEVAKEYTTLQERIATLEKENAELRDYNKYLKRKRQGGIQKQYNKVAIIKQQDDQLTKAKVFIRSLKSLIEDVCDINYLSKENCKLLVETEQFLIDPDDRFELTEKGKEYLSSH